MRQFTKPLALAASALAVGMLVTACGGGGASSPAVSGTSGFAVDGYLSAATVVCDSNGDGTASFDETSVTTDSSGFCIAFAPGPFRRRPPRCRLSAAKTIASAFVRRSAGVGFRRRFEH